MGTCPFRMYVLTASPYVNCINMIRATLNHIVSGVVFAAASGVTVKWNPPKKIPLLRPVPTFSRNMHTEQL